MTNTNDAPPADWYSDPDDGTKERFWDGSSWTDHRRSARAMAASPPPHPQTAIPVDIDAQPVAPGAGYAESVSVNPGMLHSIILLGASLALASSTAGVGLIAALFAGLASWESYKSGQAANRGEAATAAASATAAKRWRRITYITGAIIGVLAIVAFILLAALGLAVGAGY